MLKKCLLIASIVLLGMSSIAGNAQTTDYKIPYYMKSDFFVAHPNFLKFPLFGRVRHVDFTPEQLKFKPSTTRIQTADGIEVINISNGNDSQSETWIAINPKNPLNIIATSNDNKYIGGSQGGYKMNSWFTLDGGKTWKAVQTRSNNDIYISEPTQSGSSMTIFDPGVVFDCDGNAVYTYGFTQIVPSKSDAEQNGVFAVMSTNGGKSWDGWGEELPISAIALSINSSENAFHDRYTSACDNNPKSKYKNNIYCTWQKFKNDQGVMFSKSTDKGMTWIEQPYKLSSENGTQAPMPAVGPNGEIYVAWIETEMSQKAAFAVVRKSTDAGVTWSGATNAQQVISIGSSSPNGRFVLSDKQNMRVSSPPQIAVDRSDKATKGNVYVIQAGRETINGDYGIYVSSSTDGGLNWNKNQRIDDAKLRNDMFFPSITVDPITGIVAVFYYSSQNDPANKGVDGYVAISGDGGKTWNNIRVTATTSYIKNSSDVSNQDNSGYNVYWGDYTSIDAYNGNIYPLFWNYNTTAGGFQNLDLYTAMISPQPKTPTNLAATTSVTGGVSVTLTWTNPTKDLLGRDLGDFKVFVIRDGVKISEVDKTAEARYVDKDVVDGQNYTYDLKVVTSDNRSSLLVSTAIIAGGSLQPAMPTNLSWRPTENGSMVYWENPTKSADGSEVRNLEKINVYDASNKLVATIGKNVVQSSATPGAEISLEKNKFHNIYLKAVSVRSGVDTESLPSGSMLVYSGAPLKALDENFDNASVSPFYTNQTWGLTNKKAASNPNCMVSDPAGKYKNSMSDQLFLAPQIVQAGKTTLSYDHIALVHKTDACEVAISNDFGKTWKGRRWYNVESSTNWTSNDLTASTFTPETINLAMHSGDTILVRFSLNTNNVFNDEGWFIDNLKIDDRATDVADATERRIADINAFPNPAVSQTSISVRVDMDSDVNLSLYDALGNLVMNVANRFMNIGDYKFDINISDKAEGVYYLRLSVGGITKAIPLVIAR